VVEGTANVISCPAPLGQGGLGRHLAELVAAARTTGQPVRYFGTAVGANDPDGEAVSLAWLPWTFRFTPARFSPEWKSFLSYWAFDRAVAHRLPPGRVLTAFAGGAFRTFCRARQLGYRELHLESGSAHVRYARRMYDAAYRRHPLEGDWLGGRLLARTLAEYDLADIIWVNSEFARETFLAEGVPSAKLRRRTLSVDPRFRPPEVPPENPGLHVIYVGSLTVSKGVPVLIEAFARYRDPAARLTLVGGSGTRGMARFLAKALARDSRIRSSPGDPLPQLHAADVFVHPSYCDGFGYGPAEALSCGVPVIVTADTGMKELICGGVTGHVVPTGDPEALLSSLEAITRNPPHARIST
jgi:glycosyltransferase involved in cell wall biosynthesis